MSRYVVKSGDLYSDGRGDWGPRSGAYVFDGDWARERAIDCARAWRVIGEDPLLAFLRSCPDARAVRLVTRRPDTPVHEVTYALRWYSEGKPTRDYLGFRGPVDRSTAKRFLSASEARESVYLKTLYGSGGPEDVCGWKVVRILRRLA